MLIKKVTVKNHFVGEETFPKVVTTYYFLGIPFREDIEIPWDGKKKYKFKPV